jgi:hypothetical protein
MFDEGRVLVALGAGGIAFLGTKFGVLKSIPGIGPVPAAAVTILLGLFLSGGLGQRGSTADIVHGIGVGLVALGALEIAQA